MTSMDARVEQELRGLAADMVRAGVADDEQAALAGLVEALAATPAPQQLDMSRAVARVDEPLTLPQMLAAGSITNAMQRTLHRLGGHETFAEWVDRAGTEPFRITDRGVLLRMQSVGQAVAFRRWCWSHALFVVMPEVAP